MTRTSCIIPAYNEAARIGGVLKVAVGHPLIDEVIVVDDGSDDGTADVVRTFSSVKLIVQKNAGKSAAIAAGVRASSGAFLIFLDADLINLSADDLTRLVAPVLDGKADMTISLRRDALRPWLMLGLDYLSGERVMPRAFITDHLETIARIKGFGLESLMNDLALTNGARIRVVWMPGVGHVYKMRKYGMWKGLIGEVRMVANIIETVSLIGTAYQIIAMHRARVR